MHPVVAYRLTQIQHISRHLLVDVPWLRSEPVLQTLLQRQQETDEDRSEWAIACTIRENCQLLQEREAHRQAWRLEGKKENTEAKAEGAAEEKVEFW